MANNNIILPLHIAAMRVSQQGNDQLVAQASTDFSNASGTSSAEWLEGLTDKTAALDYGVHLHWSLPNVYVHGKIENEEITFRSIPNRWLVVRFFKNNNPNYTPDCGNYSKMAWLIRSNSVATNQDNNANASEGNGLQTTVIGYQSGNDKSPCTLESKILGDLTKLGLPDYNPIGDTDFLQNEASETADLTAVSYYGTSFAAYYMDSNGALGLHDALSDAYSDINAFQSNANCVLSYAVIGWHDNAEEDYFNTVLKAKLEAIPASVTGDDYVEAFNDILKTESQITLSASAVQSLKGNLDQTNMLCLGVTAQVDINIVPNASDATVHVNGYKAKAPALDMAIGNNSTEALSAYFYEQSQDHSKRKQLGIDPDILDNSHHLELILNAFQLGELRKLDHRKGAGLIQLEDSIHSFEFSRLKSGSTWTVSYEHDNSDSNRLDNSFNIANLPTAFAYLLAELNAKQAQFDQQTAEAYDAQHQLYLGWCRNMQAMQYITNPPKPAKPTPALNSSSSPYIQTGLYNHVMPLMAQAGKLNMVNFSPEADVTLELMEADTYDLFMLWDEMSDADVEKAHIPCEQVAVVQADGSLVKLKLQELLQTRIMLQYGQELCDGVAAELPKARPALAKVHNNVRQLLGISQLLLAIQKEGLAESIQADLDTCSSQLASLRKKIAAYKYADDKTFDLLELDEVIAYLNIFEGNVYIKGMNYWNDNGTSDVYNILRDNPEQIKQPLLAWLDACTALISKTKTLVQTANTDFNNAKSKAAAAAITFFTANENQELELLLNGISATANTNIEALIALFDTWTTQNVSGAMDAILQAIMPHQSAAQQLSYYHNALALMLQVISPQCVLKSIPDDVYHQALDPSICLVENVKNNTSVLQPMRRNSNATYTPCRISGELMSGASDTHCLMPDISSTSDLGQKLQALGLLDSVNTAFKEIAVLSSLDNDQLYSIIETYQSSQITTINANTDAAINLPAANTSFGTATTGTLPFYIGIEVFKAGQDNPFYPLFITYEALLKMPHLKNSDDNYDATALTSRYQLDEGDGSVSSYHTNLLYQQNQPTASDLDQYVSVRNYITLSSRSTQSLKYQIDAYIKQYGSDLDPKVKADLESASSSLENKVVLSQALNGFNAALLQEFQTLQLPINSPFPTNAVTNPSSISLKCNAEGPWGTFKPQDQYQYWGDYDGTWNATMPSYQNVPFSPIRAGFMGLKNIQLIDSFGQRLTYDFKQQANQDLIPAASLSIETHIQKDTSVMSALTVTTDSNDYNLPVELPPRFVEPTRLRFSWLSADKPVGADYFEMVHHSPEHSPICGWIVPNHLDNTLDLYNPDGSPTKYLRASDDNSVIKEYSVPGQESASYHPMMGGLVTKMKELQSTNNQFFQALMDTTEVAQGYSHPLGATTDDHLSVFVGRPLAVVRLRLRLERQGLAAVNTAEAALPKQLSKQTCTDKLSKDEITVFKPSDFSTPNYDEVKVPLMLGNLNAPEDGLIGYFIEGADMTPTSKLPLYADAIRYTTDKNMGNVISPHNSETVALSLNSEVTICAIIDPRGAIHAATGILPVQQIKLSPDVYLHALNKLAYYFLSAPVLTQDFARQASIQDTIVLPIGEVQGYDWTWIQKGDATISDAVVVKKVQHETELGTAQLQTLDDADYAEARLVEGWLRLAHPKKES